MGFLNDEDDLTFRAALDKATQASDAFRLPAITDEIERIATAHQRHVRCLCCASRSLPASSPASPKVNCHAYSLDVYRAREFQDTLAVPEAEFVEHLISSGVLVGRALDRAQDSDIVIYRSSGQIKHSGRLIGHYIHSKWGEGSVFEHTAFAAPARYGSELHLFRRPSLDQIIPIYLERCRAA